MWCSFGLEEYIFDSFFFLLLRWTSDALNCNDFVGYNLTHPPPPPPYPRFLPLFYSQNGSSFVFQSGHFLTLTLNVVTKILHKEWEVTVPSLATQLTTKTDVLDSTQLPKHSRGATSTQCYIQLWRVRLAGARLCCRKGTSCEAECEKGRVKSVRACVVLFRLNMIYTEWVIHTCEWHIFPDKRFSRESVTSRAWKAKNWAALFRETDNIATNLATSRLP